jgi:hypothetical protein
MSIASGGVAPGDPVVASAGQSPHPRQIRLGGQPLCVPHVNRS